MTIFEIKSRKEREVLYHNLKTVKDLVDFAQISALSHRAFYHYTTIETLDAIIANKTLRLTNARLMNDQQELSKGNPDFWEKTYLSCFCYGESESVAMWTMYSIPWQKGVRISFPKNKLVQYLERIKKIKLIDTNQYLQKNDFEIVLTDVIYSEFSAKDNSEFIKIDDFPNINSYEVFNDDNISRQSDITGFIKNKAWEYENETRIKIQTHHTNSSRKIEIELDSDLIESMSITLSPWSTQKLYDELKSKYPQLNIAHSKLHGKVNIISKCKKCDADYSINGYRI